MTDIKTTLAIVLATTSIAAADSKPAAKPPVKAAEAKPEPTDAKLAQLVGRWEGTSKFTIKGKTNTWMVTTSCERTTIGPAILCNSVAMSGTMKLEEVWLFGYDVSTEQYHLFMINNWGEAYDHAAKWSDAGQVAFVYTNTRDGKPVREEYKLTFKPNELRFDGLFTVDGKAIGEGTTVEKRVP